MPLQQYTQVFSDFEACKVSVDMVASSDVSVSLTLDRKQREKGDIPLLLVGEGAVCDFITVMWSQCLLI